MARRGIMGGLWSAGIVALLLSWGGAFGQQRTDRPIAKPRSEEEEAPARISAVIPMPDPYGLLSPDARLLGAKENSREGRHADVLDLLAGIPKESRLWEYDFLRARALGRVFVQLVRSERFPARAFSVDLSPDGLTLAVGGAHSQLHLYDVQSGERRRAINVGKSWTRAVRFSPDGKLLASCQDDGSIRLWNALDGTRVRAFRSQSKSVRDICFSPDGKLVATAGLDGKVILWSVLDKAEMLSCGPHRFGAGAVAFSPDGTKLASMSLGGEGFLWDAVTGEQLDTFGEARTADSASIVFSPDGTLVAYGVPGRTVLVDARTGERVLEVGQSANRVPKGVFSPDGTSLFTVRDNTVSRWDVGTGRALFRMTGRTGALFSVRLSEDGSRMALGGDGFFSVLTTGAGEAARVIGETGTRPSCLAVAANGAHVLAGHYGGYHAWGLKGTPEEATVIAGERLLAFSADGTLIASADGVHNIVVRNRSTGDVVARLTGHKKAPTVAEFSRSKRTLVSGGVDLSARVWELSTGRQSWQITGLEGPVTSVALSPGESQAVVGVRGGPVRVCRLKRREVMVRIGVDATAVAYTERGELATAGRDRVIRLWDGNSGITLGEMRGHEDRITVLKFTADGKRLVSGGADGTIRMWDPRGGIELLRLDLAGRTPVAMAFGPGQEQLFAGDARGRVYVWDSRRTWSAALGAWVAVEEIEKAPPE